VRGTDQLHAAFSNCAGCERFKLTPDLIDHNHLRVVVLDCFNHDLVLQGGLWHLHTPRLPHGWMGNVSISADLIRSIHDHHAVLLRQSSGSFAQHGGLAHPRLSKDQDALT